MSELNHVSLGQAVQTFVTAQKVPVVVRSELSRFVMLCGRECPMFTLTATEAREFVAEVKKAGDRKKRAEALETFFCFAKDNGWVRSNPAYGLVQKKEVKTKTVVAAKRDTIELSAEGRQQLEAEMKGLLARKQSIIADIKNAREEGDLSENAGYHDARERLGMLEAQIREKNDILTRGVVK